MRVLFVDTETGGFKKPLVPVEVAGAVVESPLVRDAVPTNIRQAYFNYRYKLTRDMELGALSTHHILPMDLEGKPEWDQKDWEVTHAKGSSYVVAHNAEFDLEVLGIPNYPNICTLALSRQFLPDLDSHRLGSMMYYLFGPTPETRAMLQGSHSALVDIRNTMTVLQELVKRFCPEVRNWGELHKYSELGKIPFRFTFGKYGPKDGRQGMRIKDFVRDLPINGEYRSYLSWMRREMRDDKHLMEALSNPK